MEPAWTPALFADPRPGATLCTLCPHACELAPGEIGRCRVRRGAAGGIETATRATSVRHLTPIERKPLYHVHPGRRCLTLAPPGCSFVCSYCQNYRLSQYGRPSGAPWRAEPVDAASIVAEAARENGWVALSYSEPSLAAELTLEIAERGREVGVEVVWKSNGFLTAEAATRLAPSLMAVNLDIKAADEARHRRLTGASLAPVWATLDIFLEAGVWVEATTPLIPGVCDDEASLAAIARGLAARGAELPWHLVRFNPEHKMRGARPTSVEALERAVAIGRAAGLRHVYVERALGAAGRATRCPGCDGVVVERGIWSTERVGLADGACPSCGAAIAGRWC